MSGTSPWGRVAALVASGPSVVFLGLLWFLWLLSFSLGEKLPVNDGLGWDGTRFTKMATAGPKSLVDREINSYYVQRVGPSFAVRALLSLTGQTLDEAGVRNGFVFLNVVLLSAALLLLLDAGARLGLGPHGAWILFLGLFANLPNGRFPIYYAPIGDSTAFFLGSLITWAFVSGRPGVLFAGFAASIVSWPAAFALFPLLLFPRFPSRSSPLSASSEVASSSFVKVGLLALPLGALLLVVLWVLAEMPPVERWTAAVTLSLATNALHLGLAAAIALMVAFGARAEVLKAPAAKGMVAVVLLCVLSVVYVRTFESGSLSFSAQTYVREILLFARSRALTALAGHGAYFGFLAMAALALWSRTLKESLRLGPGAFLALAAAGIMSIDAESRRLNASWPLVGLFAALAFERLLAGKRDMAIMALSSVVISKLWWPLTGPDLFPAAHSPGNYFNTQGPNMSPDAAAVHLLASALVFIWISSLGRKEGELKLPSAEVHL